MSAKAGTTLTTAHLSHTTQQTLLSDDTASATSTWEQWGTEDVTIPNPGIAVEVSAVLSGGYREATNTDAAATCRLQISLDGGTTWSDGENAFVRVGTDVGVTTHALNGMAVSGTPTGDIVIRAQLWVNQTTTELKDGTITATMVPA